MHHLSKVAPSTVWTQPEAYLRDSGPKDVPKEKAETEILVELL